ncbi:hypothetical protein RA210_U140093 [Rubrivivax sp. A210]|nr:hypothetical protein RA210_U140093 [Rubrivivax sp. A210]
MRGGAVVGLRRSEGQCATDRCPHAAAERETRAWLPLRLCSLSQITSLPRQTVPHKLEGLTAAGKVRVALIPATMQQSDS